MLERPNRYKVSKQADVLMLFYLFSAEALGGLFRRLGYPWRPDAIPETVRYYLDLTRLRTRPPNASRAAARN